MPVVMTDLIIGHIQGTHLFCQSCSHIKCTVAKLSQSTWAGGTCWGGNNVLPRSLYSSSDLGLILFSYLLPRAKEEEKKSCSSLARLDVLNGALHLKPFYRVQIRCNFPLVANPPINKVIPPYPHFTDHHPKHFVFQRLTFSSRLVLFLPNFFFLDLQAARQKIRQAASRCGSVQDCSTRRGCASPVKNLVSLYSNRKGLTGPINDKSQPLSLLS